MVTEDILIILSVGISLSDDAIFHESLILHFNY